MYRQSEKKLVKQQYLLHMSSSYVYAYVLHSTTKYCIGKVCSSAGLRFVFQDLPEPNRACLVGVYAVTLDPLLSLYGIIYVTLYTRHLPKPTGVRFR